MGQHRVSKIGLGLWQFGSPQWELGDDRGTSRAGSIVQRSLDFGINLFDTAEIYGHGRSEEIFGGALGGRRSEAVVATKVTPWHIWRSGVVNAANRSLGRLGMDVIDLYQVHWPNRFIPISSTMRGMRDLIDAGKVREAGVSNFPLSLWRTADRHLGRPVVSNQVQFSLLDMTPLDDLVPFAQQNDRVIIAYSPLAQGVLGGRYHAGATPTDFRASNPLFSTQGIDATALLVEDLSEIARKHEATPSQIALAWLLHIPNVVAIPGARTVEQVEENAGAAEIELSEDEWQRLKSRAASIRPPRQRRKRVRIASLILGARFGR